MITQKVTITANSVSDAAEKICHYKNEGFKVVEATEKTYWPFFWIKVVTVTMERTTWCYELVVPGEFIINARKLLWRPFPHPTAEVTLQSQLQQAIDNEDYELAAKLRDQIKNA